MEKMEHTLVQVYGQSKGQLFLCLRHW